MGSLLNLFGSAHMIPFSNGEITREKVSCRHGILFNPLSLHENNVIFSPYYLQDFCPPTH